MAVPYDFYLASEYFDKNVDYLNENISCEDTSIKEIQEKINNVLDEHFKDTLQANKESTKKVLKELEKYPTLEPFVDKDELINQTRNPITLKEITEKACDIKIKAEVDYWNNEKTKYQEDLIKTSLFNYLRHRYDVLNNFKTDLLENYTQNSKGDLSKKKQNEKEIHNWIFPPNQDKYLQNNEHQLYFNHNLWLIDDKYSLFKEAKSATNGKSEVDIYISNNDIPQEICLIELKSTHKAHNAGKMLEQVKAYAIKIYNKKDSKLISGDVSDTKKAKYTAYILASIESIQREVDTYKNYPDILSKIPFLTNSYYHNGVFDDGNNAKINIRIELIAYTDLYTLAKQRNEPLFKLMNLTLNN